MYIYIYIYIYICAYACVCVVVHMYIYMVTYQIRVGLNGKFVSMSGSIFLSLYTDTYVPACINTYMYTNIHARVVAIVMCNDDNNYQRMNDNNSFNDNNSAHDNIRCNYNNNDNHVD